MKNSLRTGITFGMTSGVITTLGLMTGLHSGTHSKIIILGGILTIAIADAFSDALGIHIAEESENIHTFSQIWTATIATFFSKFLFSLTFAVPIILLPLSVAICINMIWGISILAILSYVMAKVQKKTPWKIMSEHVCIAVIVVLIAYWVGAWVKTMGQ